MEVIEEAYILETDLFGRRAALGLSLILVTMTFAWEGRLSGRPTMMEPGGTFGVFAWTDGEGLHLRSVARRDFPHHFSGVITTDGQIFNLHMIGAAGDDDTANVSGNRRQLTYSFNTYDGIDGVDYDISGGTYQSVSAYYQGSLMEVENIYLGTNGAHPENNPLTDTR